MFRSTIPHRTRRRAHTVDVHPTARRHRGAVAAWALAHGHPADRDALAVLVGLRTGSGGRVDSRWTIDLADRAVGDAAALWCDRHGVDVPGALTTTLLTYVRYLSAHRSLAAGSDGVAALRRSLGTRPAAHHGTRARHPAGGAVLAPVLPIS